MRGVLYRHIVKNLFSTNSLNVFQKFFRICVAFSFPLLMKAWPNHARESAVQHPPHLYRGFDPIKRPQIFKFQIFARTLHKYHLEEHSYQVCKSDKK